MTDGKLDRKPVIDQAIEKIKLQLNEVEKVENDSDSILNEDAENRIRKKLANETMGVREWIKGRWKVFRLDSKLKNSDIKFYVGDWFDSLIDFVKKTELEIEKVKTETQLQNLMLKIKTEKPTKEKETDTSGQESLKTVGGNTIASTVEMALEKNVSGEHCGDRVMKIYKASGFEDRDIVRAFQGEPYNYQQSKSIGDKEIKDGIEYQKNKENYEKLLDFVKVGDYLIFHNGNKFDEYGNHSGIFLGRDESQGGKPSAKIASLPGKNKKANIKNYNLGRGEKTKYGRPKGQICAIRRVKKEGLSEDAIAENLEQLPTANA